MKKNHTPVSVWTSDANAESVYNFGGTNSIIIAVL